MPVSYEVSVTIKGRWPSSVLLSGTDKGAILAALNGVLGGPSYDGNGNGHADAEKEANPSRPIKRRRRKAAKSTPAEPEE